MTKRMLIDATHAEETRVVVLDGTRLEDFDVETSAKRHLKGNIYLAKIVRVEPSLQAAFVEYGGNRHGFLAFSEIHPDYYQIPIADRQRLVELEAEEARREEEEDELELALSEAVPPPQPPRVSQPARSGRGRRDGRDGRNGRQPVAETAIVQALHAEAWALPGTPPLITTANPAADPPEPDAVAPESWALAASPALTVPAEPEAVAVVEAALVVVPEASPETVELTEEERAETEAWALSATPALFAAPVSDEPSAEPAFTANDDAGYAADDRDRSNGESEEADEPAPETLGGDPDAVDEPGERRLPSRFLRSYKIQEVIHRRQIMLVQVVKEERGTKGAALTTYLSLAGRFSVLMPNSPRGGGISRKITSATDRRRLKEVMTELDIPRGMGLIIRTAGAARPKPEIKRDCEYLLRLWDDIRDHTMKSIAPAMIYEEASLIKRTIRDVYARDIDEIQVDGVEGWRAAHEFMRMLMPTHARKVQLWRDQSQPLFARYQVEAQLDAMLIPTVQLRSGGYLVINQAEALVAIDVNSGRSTRERNIEETALRTNLEAADEVARQLRLRDLAGLIVIDFIDMESRRHNAMVERRLKDALRNDRARIQIGSISHFGLLEMSRQRLRPSLAETSFVACPHCGGTGHVRSTESAAIHVLRGIEEEGSKRRSAEIIVHVPTPIALYLLNHKRDRLREIEQRYGMRVIIAADDSQISPAFRIERARAQVPGETPSFITPDFQQPILPPHPADDIGEDDEVPDEPTDTVEEVRHEPRRDQRGSYRGEARGDQRGEARGDQRGEARGDQRGEARGEPRAEASEEARGDARVEAREMPVADEASTDITAESTEETRAAASEAEEQERRRRRRRRRRGRREDGTAIAGEEGDESQDSDGPETTAGDVVVAEAVMTETVATETVEAGAPEAGGTEVPSAEEAAADGDDDGKGRRRGRRGGRRRRRDEGELLPVAEPGADQPELPPVYTGPTPANPFGGQVFDIFDVMDQVERVAEARALIPTVRPREPAQAQADALTPSVADEAVAETTAPEPVAVEMPAEPVVAEAEVVSPMEPVADAPVPAEPIVAAPVVEPLAPEVATPEPPTPEVAIPEVAIPELSPLAASAPEPAVVSAEAVATPAPAEPAPAAPEPTSESVIKPIVIGQDATAPAERKRGWWRRS